MRRGFYFEIQLEKIIEHLNENNVHAHKNHPRRTTGGVYVEGEPFDYEVFTRRGVHVFDAKESKTDEWSLSNAKAGQIKHLQNCKIIGGAEAYFLVLFEYEHVRRFDVEFVIKSITDGKKSLTKEEGAPWDWTELLA
jgi:penicillin-binding protein-related factor A (putative recombinase)